MADYVGLLARTWPVIDRGIRTCMRLGVLFKSPWMILLNDHLELSSDNAMRIRRA